MEDCTKSNYNGLRLRTPDHSAPRSTALRSTAIRSTALRSTALRPSAVHRTFGGIRQEALRRRVGERHSAASSSGRYQAAERAPTATAVWPATVD